ncbi:MAG: Gfo/Idh/MocA family protein [Pirellulales bacterium]
MSNMHRRQFLETTAAGATVALAGRALRAEDTPNNKIAVAIMGVNGRGAGLASGFAKLPGCEVAYVCDVDQHAVDKGVNLIEGLQSRKPEGVTDFRRILDDKSVDALLIATPDHWHAPATILACAAQKHVYVEKPACHNPREGELMIAAARKQNRVVQVGTQRRSSTGIQAGIKRLHDGEIGKVLFARAWINGARPEIGFGKPAAPPAHIDWTLWQGPAPESEFHDNYLHYNWHWFWNWGTGELGNNGVHALDLCRWGMQVDSPIKVTCGGGKYHFQDDQETPDTQLATFDFGDRVILWEHRTWHKRGPEGAGWGAAFYGEKGSMVISDKVAFHDMNSKLLDEAPVNNGEVEHQQDFLDCIRSGQRPAQDVESGVQSTMLCLLGNIAYRTGQTVNLDPQTHQIVDNPQQQALWSREYRPGWEPTV